MVAPMPPLPSEALLMENFYTRPSGARKSDIVKRLERDIKAFVQKRLSPDFDLYLTVRSHKIFLWVRTRIVGCKGVYCSYETYARDPDEAIQTLELLLLFQ